MRKLLYITTLSTLVVSCVMPSGTVHNIDDVGFDELKQLLTYQYSSKDSFNYVKPQLNIDIAKQDTKIFEREYQALYNRLIGSQCKYIEQEIDKAYKEYNKHAESMEIMDGMVKLTMALSLLNASQTGIVYEDGSTNTLAGEYLDNYGVKGIYNGLIPTVGVMYDSLGLNKPDYQAYKTAYSRLSKAKNEKMACSARMNKHQATLFNKVKIQSNVCESHQWFKNYSGQQLKELCAIAVTEDFISRLNSL